MRDPLKKGEDGNVVRVPGEGGAGNEVVRRGTCQRGIGLW